MAHFPAADYGLPMRKVKNDGRWRAPQRRFRPWVSIGVGAERHYISYLLLLGCSTSRQGKQSKAHQQGRRQGWGQMMSDFLIWPITAPVGGKGPLVALSLLGARRQLPRGCINARSLLDKVQVVRCSFSPSGPARTMLHFSPHSLWLLALTKPPQYEPATATATAFTPWL